MKNWRRVQRTKKHCCVWTLYRVCVWKWKLFFNFKSFFSFFYRSFRLLFSAAVEREEREKRLHIFFFRDGDENYIVISIPFFSHSHLSIVCVALYRVFLSFSFVCPHSCWTFFFAYFITDINFAVGCKMTYTTKLPFISLFLFHLWTNKMFVHETARKWKLISWN